MIMKRIITFAACTVLMCSNAVGQRPAIPGDFTLDGLLTAEDIDMLQLTAVKGLSWIDLNQDQVVDESDLRVWVKDLKKTWIGDANLDGEFNSTDLIEAMASGKYELAVDAGWAEGDWTADLRFNSTDFVAAISDNPCEFCGPPPRPAMPAIQGDFTLDGQLTAEDIDVLTLFAVRGISWIDLTQDQVVDVDDLNVWVNDLKKTWIGDANLDYEFNSSDLIEVLAAGKYEQDVDAGWAEGDWNADQRANSADLVAALQGYGCGGRGAYECGPRPATAAVPEPRTIVLVWMAALVCAWTARRCAA
jgi:hypothetical protein